MGITFANKALLCEQLNEEKPMVKTHGNEFRPDYAVAPGEVLGEELEVRGMTQQELAKRTGLSPNYIVSVVQAKSSITPETALKFERTLGMPADYWLNLESEYQQALPWDYE
ncbi:addiction module HigA family antidote [Trinickia symbiotica]|nr:HigA family addiction module antitoxin [Trinickia symbiotica]PPK41947.1 addiction module HigA family antidote [Trinickia symbiotica]